MGRKKYRDMPAALRLGLWTWLAVSGLLLASAAAVWLQAVTQDANPAGPVGFAVLVAAFALLQLVFAFQLPGGRRFTREMLTTFGLIGGIPLFFRSVSALWVVAALMVAAVALLWLPASSRYLRLHDPKPPKPGRRRLRSRPPG